MNCIVIYHSISGNTKKIAFAIYEGISQAGENCDIKKVNEIKPDGLQQYDLIGLGSPVQKLREMRNITGFISGMKNVDRKHGFAFCTHGAAPANYLASVVPAMTQKGIDIIGWNDWFGSCFHPGVPKPYFTDGHPDEIDLREARDFGRLMVERSHRISEGEKGLIPAFPRGKDYDDIYNPSVPIHTDAGKQFNRVNDRLEFKINRDKCNYPRCTTCIDNCPMQSIDFSVSPVYFDSNCAKCFLCVQTCPGNAIEVDWQDFHALHSQMIGTLEELLKIFEARGKFRRLVPEDKIGWNNFVWQMKHPLYKLP